MRHGLAKKNITQIPTCLHHKQERNRKLAADLSSLKRQLETQSEAEALAQRNASTWEAKATAAMALVDRLEGDLAAVRHGASVRDKMECPGRQSALICSEHFEDARVVGT